MNKCPKCGADWLARGRNSEAFACGTELLASGQIDQDILCTANCRIRELEAQLSSVRAHMDYCRSLLGVPDDEVLAASIEEMKCSLSAANQRIRELTEWRPMESAPKDVPILTKMKHGVIEGVWDGEEARGYYFQDMGWYPKGWLPLPQ